VIGFGNPGRRDDGLGAAAVERLSARRLPGVTCDADYQLNIEDALACAGHDLVIFIDAARGLRKPYTFTKVRPAGTMPPMSHALMPEAVLAITAELYDRRPDARLLAIGGQGWDIGEGLTERAERNLAQALEFLEGFLKETTS
jgi:hydrogenase maturation protease